MNRCRLCASRTDIIEDDGAVVCRSCITYLGRIANDPTTAEEGVLVWLLTRHETTVRLVRADGTTERLRWQA
jgi:hypothetical protein